MIGMGSDSPNELAIAMYAAQRGIHRTRSSETDAQWHAFAAAFNEPAVLEALGKQGVRWLPASSGYFSRPLRETLDPPAGLFVRGAGEFDVFGGQIDGVSMFERPMVAVVGARACSGYGASVARSLARELAQHGVIVVSGLARGIDAEAHRGALDAGGTTIAVLGCGIDRMYPAAHEELGRRICDRGVVVSEYAPGVEPAPWRFPARNRIVAGLCSATIVVEARERSGALITVDLALEAGRQVFAVPGEITSALSAGTNQLLRVDGVRPLLGAGDVLAALGLDNPGASMSLVPADDLEGGRVS